MKNQELNEQIEILGILTKNEDYDRALETLDRIELLLVGCALRKVCA